MGNKKSRLLALATFAPRPVFGLAISVHRLQPEDHLSSVNNEAVAVRRSDMISGVSIRTQLRVGAIADAVSGLERMMLWSNFKQIQVV